MDSGILFLLCAPFVGSFLGLVSLRLPLGQQIAVGRSKCPKCDHTLAFWHLMPVLSFLIQRGRCGYCSEKISFYYPIMELSAVTVVVWAAFVTTGAVFVASCFLGWALLVLMTIDWRYMILPDVLTYPLMISGIGVIAYLNPDRVIWHLAALIAALVILGGLLFVYRHIRKRDGLGWGDVKLFMAAGAWVGPEGLGSMLLLSTILALLGSFAVAALGKKELNQFGKIPFGSYLSAGLWLTWLYGPLVWF